MADCNKQYIDKETKSVCAIMLEQIADKIRNARSKKDSMPLRTLSNLSGVSTAVISDLENRKYLPKLDALIRLALALDITVSDLLVTLAPKNEVMNLTNKLDKKEKEETTLREFLSGFGLKGADIIEVLNFIEFKKQQQDRIKWFK